MKLQLEQTELPQEINDENKDTTSMEKPIDPYLGYMIRGYCLEELLGRGKVTSLYLGRTEELWQMPDVIMMLLHVPETFSPQARRCLLERFSHEAKRIAQLRHRSLFPLFGYGEEQGLPYLVMPVVSGVSLAVYLKWQKRWSPSEILAILEPVATALTYIHSQGLVYQFLNPTNILLQQDAPPQITGLYLPQMLGLTSFGQEIIDASSYDHLKDIAGDYLGAAEYLAPEVVRGEKADARSDVYSLGVILFEMLSGKPPFAGRNYLEVAQKHVQEPLPALCEGASDFPAALELVMQCALHRDSDQRFQTPDELITAYSSVLDEPLSALKQVHLSPAGRPMQAPPSRPSQSIGHVGQTHNRVPNSDSVVVPKQVPPSSLAGQPMQAPSLPRPPKILRNVSQIHNRATDPRTVRGAVDIGTLPREVSVTPVTTSGFITNLLRYMWGKLPLPVQRIIIVILTRASDPEPEELYASGQQATISSAMTWGWLPMVTLTSALGLFIIAFAFNSSRDNDTGLYTFFFLGLLVILVPTVVRLVSPATSRTERIGLLCILGMCYYLINVMRSPLYYGTYDEFLHWRTAEDIYKTRHLFSRNVLLAVSPYYPGLEIVTNALSTVSGLDNFSSGLIIIRVARFAMVFSLFIIYERIVKSPRIASIATLIYMSNTQFFQQDARFIYEAFALPLGVFMIFAMGPYDLISFRLKHPEPVAPSILVSRKRCEDMTNSLSWISLASWLPLCAMVLTHHLTSIFFDGFLVLWAVMDAVVYRTPLLRSRLAVTAAIALIVSVANVLHPGNPVIHYAGSSIAATWRGFERLLLGASSQRQLFVSYTHQPPLIWTQMIGISSMALILLCIPFGLLCLWQRYRSNVLAVTFGVLSLLYLMSQGLQFTDGEILRRLSAFFFIPISFVVAIFIAQFWPTRSFSWKQMVLVTCTLLIVFLGGVILEANSRLSKLPGPYEVISDDRSVEPEGIQAALWARSHLDPNSRIAADFINRLLMYTYGEQRVQGGDYDSIDLSDVFLLPSLGPDELSLLRQSQTRYLVVDFRLTRSLPVEGLYYTDIETGVFQHATPVDVKALTKFNTIPQINKVFDGGDIVIYDVGGLLNAP